MVNQLMGRVLELFDKSYPGTSLVILEAPTGYGKTSNSYLPFIELKSRGLVGGFIYVAPTRALVRQQAGAFLGALIGYSVSYQSMDLNLEVEVNGRRVRLGKNPKLDSDVNVTTVDSFIYNILRMPVAEIPKQRWYYPIYSQTILSSYVFLDEAHLLVEEDGTAFTSLVLSTWRLASSHTPTVVATATLGDRRIQALVNSLPPKYRGGVRVVRLWLEDRDEGIVSMVRDEEFESYARSIKWGLQNIRRDELLDKVRSVVQGGGRVLVLANTVADAVSMYQEVVREVDADRAVLLHGRLDEVDRDNNSERIEGASVVVGTDAVGVGINLHGVNTLIMQLPQRVDTFIQRVGRICRDRNNGEECEVYIISDGNGVPGYYMEIMDLIEKGKVINWRLPYDTQDALGYARLLNNLEAPDIDPSTYEDIDSLQRFLVVDQKSLHETFRRHCNLVRDSVLVRAFTRSDIGEIGDLRYSLPIQLEYAAKLLREGWGRPVIFSVSEGGLDPVDDEGVRDCVMRIGRSEYGECTVLINVNWCLGKRLGKSGRGAVRDIIWGVDVSRVYQRGIGLVV